MTCAQILGYPLLVVSALELFLGVLLLKQNTRNSPVNRSIATFSFFAAAFALSTAFMYIRSSLGLDYHSFARASWIGWFTIPAALQAVFYLNDEKSKRARAIGLILYPFWVVVLCLSLFTDFVVTPEYTLYPFHNRPGPLENPLRLSGGLLIFWLMAEIIRLRRRVSGLKRSQLNYFLSGTLIFGAGGAVTAGFIQLFTGHGVEPGLASYFSLPWVVLTFYAITRYRLFDIRFVISRTLLILLLSLCISVLQFVLFKLLEPAVGAVATIFVTIPIIGLLFFGTPLSRKVQKWINDIVLRDKYIYRQMLKESIQAMISILNRDELLRHIVESVRRGLKVQNACLYLVDDNGLYTMRHGFGIFRGMTGTFVLFDRAVRVMLRTKQPLILGELQSASPQEETEDLIIYLRKIRSETILPLFYKDRLQGALTLGEKGDGEPYDQSDIDLLTALAGHAAVAIENARLFEDACRIRESLDESEGIFQTLAETTAAAIFIHQGDKFVYANTSGSVQSGYSREELLNMNFWDLVHPEYRTVVKERSFARLRGENPQQHYEIKIITRSGEERWEYLTAGVIEYRRKPAIIGTLMDITDLKQAQAEKERLYEESAKQFQARIEEQQRHQNEKERILKDLHDGIGGLTTNINLLAELARKSPALADVRKSLATIAELSRESLSEIRGFIQSLDTRELSWRTVTAELRHLGSTLIEPHGLSFTIATSVDDLDASPSSPVTMNLFRIYKESLVNIIKHSKASAVDVSFTVHDKKVVLDIRDNGSGLKEKRGTGRGLTNMKTRTEELGGVFDITSGSGTRVHLEIPIP